ncbi:DUF4209 domain-containing protein, partial [Aeromonas veronii]|uniref:DUF4209 domain-containing protein n=1 Tax=Aeromonas veronii TaxID=654 RepID=UPI001F3C4524
RVSSTRVRCSINVIARASCMETRLDHRRSACSNFINKVRSRPEVLPALRHLLMEHRFTKELMVAACYHSPIVPQNREELLGYALWLGFEYEFGAAIHLLCPQVEHIVRSQLKEAGAHTTNIDREGIENENGLSTLMDLQEALKLFGEDLTFEIKSVFTDALGFNLRNEVAHGLLDDNTSASIHTIYAWWMILRLVIRSIVDGSPKK